MLLSDDHDAYLSLYDPLPSVARPAFHDALATVDTVIESQAEASDKAFLECVDYRLLEIAREVFARTVARRVMQESDDAIRARLEEDPDLHEHLIRRAYFATLRRLVNPPPVDAWLASQLWAELSMSDIMEMAIELAGDRDRGLDILSRIIAHQIHNGVKPPPFPTSEFERYQEQRGLCEGRRWVDGEYRPGA